MSVCRVTLGALVALLVTAVAGAPATGEAAPVTARAQCDPSGLVVQAMNGRVSACVRLGNVASGRHTIALQQPGTFAPSRVTSRPGRPAPTPSEPVVRLTLSPGSGGPGTVVTVTGRLRRPLRRDDLHPNACWDGCQNGLPYGDVALHWVSARTFRARIVVPAAPWVENAPGRVVTLRTGTYPVGIDCLRMDKGCEAVTEGEASFHLRVARPVAWCRTPASCARLRVTPARAAPGQLVRVTGVAPLVEGNMGATGSGYDTVLQRGRPRSAIRFAAESLTVGRGAIEVTAPPAYRAVAPLAQVRDGLTQIAADPADPGTVAWCSDATISVSGPAGATIIPTTSARPVVQSLGFSLRDEPQLPCAAVAPITTSTGSPAGLAVAFSVTVAAGAPPFYLAALVTHDDGATWTAIPVPRGSATAGFGGFRYVGATLQAVFARSVKQASSSAYPDFDATRALAEVVGADGQTWAATSLGCPAAGPCVTFGPYLTGNCAMNGTQQVLLRSRDAGRTWTPLDFPDPVQACGEAELVATSATSELLVDSTSTYPVLRTSDGGATWHDVAPPRRGGQGDLTVLPDGSLVMAGGLGYSGPWKLLRRGRRAWCALAVPSGALRRHAYQLGAPAVIGGALWWLTGSLTSATAAPTLHELSLSALSC